MVESLIETCVALMAGGVFIYWLKRRTDRALWALHYWLDMGKLFGELREDPFMTTAKWKEWLPLFEDADRIYEKFHPDPKRFLHYSELVQREIAYDFPEEQEVGS